MKYKIALAEKKRLMILATGFVDLAEALNKSCLYMQQINWGWCVFMVETGTKS